MAVVTYVWRGDFDTAEANALHAEAFETRLFSDAEWNWNDLVAAHSLGWVVARDVALARAGARDAGCEWLHVDFDEALGSFYVGACGFTPTTGGLVALQ